MNPHVSPLELLWLAFGLFGLFVTLANYHDAAEDRALLVRGGRNGLLLQAADEAVRREIDRYVLLVTMVAIGILAMTVPTRPIGEYANVQVAQACLLVAVEIQVVRNSLAARRARKRLIEYGTTPWGGHERRRQPTRSELLSLCTEQLAQARQTAERLETENTEMRLQMLRAGILPPEAQAGEGVA